MRCFFFGHKIVNHLHMNDSRTGVLYRWCTVCLNFWNLSYIAPCEVNPYWR